MPKYHVPPDPNAPDEFDEKRFKGLTQEEQIQALFRLSKDLTVRLDAQIAAHNIVNLRSIKNEKVLRQLTELLSFEKLDREAVKWVLAQLGSVAPLQPRSSECKGCDYDYNEDCKEGCQKLISMKESDDQLFKEAPHGSKKIGTECPHFNACHQPPPLTKEDKERILGSEWLNPHLQCNGECPKCEDADPPKGTKPWTCNRKPKGGAGNSVSYKHEEGKSSAAECVGEACVPADPEAPPSAPEFRFIFDAVRTKIKIHESLKAEAMLLKYIKEHYVPKAELPQSWCQHHTDDGCTKMKGVTQTLRKLPHLIEMGDVIIGEKEWNDYLERLSGAPDEGGGT
jgi:hypothetical protein